MLEEQQLAQLKSILENAQSVIVIVGQQGSADSVAAALALHLSLRASGKDARLLAPKQTQATDKLYGIDQLSTELGNENLTISFDYSEEQVDKVSYHIGEETNKFYLTIKPRSGQPPLDTDSIEFNYTGASADVVILFNVTDYDSLGQLYYGYEDLYTNAQVVTVGRTSIGEVELQLLAEPDGSYSQLVMDLLEQTSFPIDSQIATDLLYGVEYASKGFSEEASPRAFELAAQLLRKGADRLYEPPQKQSQPQQAPSSSRAIGGEVMRSGTSVQKDRDQQQKQKNSQQKQQKKQGRKQNKQSRGSNKSSSQKTSNN